jgi:hypothetical protein
MFYYLTQRWAWKQLTVLDAVRDVSPAAGEVVEQAVNGYCSFESAEAFNMFAHARTEAEDMCIGSASAATVTRVLVYSARTATHRLYRFVTTSKVRSCHKACLFGQK